MSTLTTVILGLLFVLIGPFTIIFAWCATSDNDSSVGAWVITIMVLILMGIFCMKMDIIADPQNETINYAKDVPLSVSINTDNQVIYSASGEYEIYHDNSSISFVSADGTAIHIKAG